MTIRLNKLKKPYLIAEIGINHNGDLDIVKRLIDAAFACGWDCVKFQKKNPDICIPKNRKKIIKETPWGRMTYLEYKKRLEFGKRQYDYIDRYCKEKPISWAASVWDMDSLNFIKQYNTAFIKIPSARITDLKLIEAASTAGNTVILSTGMSTLKTIDKAVDVLKKNTSNFALMHTISDYPAKIGDLNIKCIETLRKRYDCEVGYSGHEYGLEPTVFATVLGAMIIERHITLDHNMWGTDQSLSIEPMGMDMLYKRIRNVRQTLGDGKKRITEGESEMIKKFRGR